MKEVYSIDIAVLDNDIDPEGRTLQVVGLPLIEGGKADGHVRMSWTLSTNTPGLIVPT